MLLPIPFFSIKLFILSIASSDSSPLKSSEFINFPLAEEGKSSASMTCLIGISYFCANSKSLSSCAGTPMTTPVP